MQRRYTWKPVTFDVSTHVAVDRKLAFDIELFEAVIARDPENIEALFSLGNAYTKRGQYIKGLDIDQRLVDIMPDDGTVRYNLACSYSLLGEVDLALEELTIAIELGYDDLEFMQTDPDLKNVRNDSRFQDLVSLIETWEST